MSWSYLIAISTDAIALVVALYFLISDGIKYPGNTHNNNLSLVTLIFGIWVGLSFFLYQRGNTGPASIMAWIPAIPLLGYGLFVLMFIIFRPDMR